MPKPRDNKTRVDFHVEQLEPIFEDASCGDPKEMARGMVSREDELIWAHHRDPKTNLTQIEARNRAQTTDYPERYNLSQSSISRKLGDFDDRMLTQPVETLRMKEPSIDGERQGLLDPELLDTLNRHHHTDFLEAYRATLAGFLVDLEALGKFKDGETPTPRWVQDRFPDLDPDTGRKLFQQLGWSGVDVHPPSKELAADGAGGD